MQRDTPVRLGLSIRSKLSWCGAVCQAPKWLLPRSGGSGMPCFSPQCMHSRSAAKVGGVCIGISSPGRPLTPPPPLHGLSMLALRAWAQPAEGGRGVRLSPLAMDWRGRRVPVGNLVQCRRALPTLSTRERSRRLSDEASGQGARRARPEEDAQCLYTPPHSLRLTSMLATQRRAFCSRHAGRRGV